MKQFEKTLFFTELEVEMAAGIMDYLKEASELHYCDLMAYYSYCFEFYYTSTARKFLAENIDLTFEALEELHDEFDGLNFLFEGGIDECRIANAVYEYKAYEVWCQLLHKFEEVTGRELWNERYDEDDEEKKETHELLIEFINAQL